mmetsp:Transcript_10192/g.15650  ORF Transcript_10192/g.15650 Transcript_10192/m.15650 type:complete len:669 (+) Transcript_10192:53-2059(+)
MKILPVSSSFRSISFYLLLQLASAFVTVFKSPHQLSKTITSTTLRIKISDLKKNSGAASNRVFRYSDKESSGSSSRIPTSTGSANNKEGRSQNGGQSSSNRYGTQASRKNIFSHNLPMTGGGSESESLTSASMPYGNFRTDRPTFTYGPEISKNPLFDHNKPVTKDKSDLNKDNSDPRYSSTPYADYGSKYDGYDRSVVERTGLNNEERPDQVFPYHSSEPARGESYDFDGREHSDYSRDLDESRRYRDFRYDSSKTPPREDNRGNQYARELYDRGTERSYQNFDYGPSESQPMANGNNNALYTSTYDEERSSRSFDYGPTCSVVQDCKSKRNNNQDVVDVEYTPDNSWYDHNSQISGSMPYNNQQSGYYGQQAPSKNSLFEHNTPVTYNNHDHYSGRPVDSPYVRSPNNSPHNDFNYGPESSVVSDYYDSGKSYYDEQIDGDYERTWQQPSYTRPSHDVGQRREFNYGPGSNDVSTTGARGYEPQPFTPYEPQKEMMENNYGNSLVVLNDESNHKPFYYGGSEPSSKPLFDHNKPVTEDSTFDGVRDRRSFDYGSSQPSSTPLFDHNRPVTEEHAKNVRSYAPTPQYRNNISQTKLEQTATVTDSLSDDHNDIEIREAEYGSAIESLDYMLTETTPRLSAMVQEATEALNALERWKDFVRHERERLG